MTIFDHSSLHAFYRVEKASSLNAKIILISLNLQKNYVEIFDEFYWRLGEILMILALGELAFSAKNVIFLEKIGSKKGQWPYRAATTKSNHVM